ncbi:MAG: 2Fe-2S iron-sulfur cluster-binding protein [Alphaproteobacteria bacterium]
MVGIIEAAGWAIVGGSAAQAATGLYGAIQRRLRESATAARDARLFEQRARLLLQSDRADRERSELSWNGNRKFYIDRKVEEAKDICSFYLKPHDDKPLAPFLPGQYLTFQLKIPGQAKPLVRCYSLSDTPTNLDHYRVTIKRLDPPPKKPDAPPGLSSNYFHRELKEGAILDVRAPAGHFHLDQTAEKPVVLIGGGVGLTPVWSMLNTICALGSRRETWFFYGVTNRTDHAMYERMKEIRRDHDNVRIVVCYSRPTESCTQGSDYDHQGFVSVELFRKLLPSNNYEFYICGPPPMMQAVTNDLKEWGVPDGDVHFEAFGPATIKRTSPAKPAQDAAASDGIEVVFARSDKILTWKPERGSLLDFAEENGISIDYGCRAGNCGTCVTAVKEGEVTYLSEPGAEPDKGSCLTCIAVPRSRLVLDG